METNLADGEACGKQATCKEKEKLCIVFGPYRLKDAHWSSVHAMTLQGWFAIREGGDVLVHYADIQEGTA